MEQAASLPRASPQESNSLILNVVTCVVVVFLLIAAIPQTIVLPITLIGRVALGVALEYACGRADADKHIVYRVYNVITMPIWLTVLERICLSRLHC